MLFMLAFVKLTIASDSGPVNYLSGMTVYDVTQDKQGYIWFGTNSGLYRFDGIEKKSFSTRDGLPGNEILRTHLAPNGDIWLLNFTGIPSFIRDGKIFSIHNVEYLQESITNSPHLSVFSADTSIWIASELGPLLKIDLNLHNPIQRFATIVPINHIYISETDQSFITVRGAPYQFDTSNFSIEPINDTTEYVSNRMLYIDNHPFLPTRTGIKNITGRATPAEYNFLDRGITDRIIAAIKTIDNKLIVGTSNGLFILDKEDNKPAYTLLSDVFVSSLFEDREGNIWVSTLGHGAYLYPVGTWNYKAFRTDDLGINRFLSIQKIRDYLFVGGIGSELVYMNYNNEISRINLFPDEPTPQIATLAYKSGTLLAGGINEFAYIRTSDDDPKNWEVLKLQLSAVKDFYISHPDTFYVSSVQGIHKVIKSGSTFELEAIYKGRTTALCVINADRILIGTSLGLKKWENGTLKRIERELTREQITVLKCNNDGTTFIGTNGGGLWKYNHKTEIFAPFLNDDNRLSSIRDLIIDNDNNLWIASASGLFKYDGHFLIKIAQGNIRSMIPDRDNVIYITSGILGYLPLTEIELRSYPFSITDLMLRADDVSINLNNTVRLPKNTETISISLRAPFFGKPDQIKYYYQFGSISGNWISSAIPEFTFRRLPVGSYSIFLKATVNGDFIESDIQEIQLRIIPPFWQQAWFVITFTILGLAAILFIFSKRIETERKQAAEKLLQTTRMVELEQQALNAMMNPHFVFNVLNSIRFYLDEKGFEKAQAYLTQFSKLIRMQLEGSFNKYISLSQELERLEMYVNLESLRLRNTLEFNVTRTGIDEDEFEEILVPALVLQPFVENAILHGIQPKNTCGVINIKLSLPHQHILEVIIEDNGIGINAARNLNDGKKLKKESLAMHLTKERLNLLTFQTGYRSRIVTEERAEGGTRVTLQIPV